MTIAIGSSVVEDATVWDYPARQQQCEQPARGKDVLPSLILDACQSNNNNNNNKRFLLQGPTVLASSLTMDLALSLASNEPCRCRTFGGREYDGCENCVSVSLIVPAVSAVDEETFPLLCRPAPGACGENDPSQMNEFLVAAASITQIQQRRREQNRFQPDTTQQHALQGIHVRHVAELDDVMHYLLSLAGLPLAQQPVGGILIDGLDRLVGQQSQDPATVAIQMSQIGTCQRQIENY